jgi:hypothetical protein
MSEEVRFVVGIQPLGDMTKLREGTTVNATQQIRANILLNDGGMPFGAVGVVGQRPLRSTGDVGPKNFVRQQNLLTKILWTSSSPSISRMSP